MSLDKLMKGHTWAKGKKRMTYPALAEVKVDEIRLDVQRDGDYMFHSYADKPLHNLNQFTGSFHAAMTSFDWPRLDMGVIVNGNFNDTYRFVRSSKGIPTDLLGVKVEFILFDLPFSPSPMSERVLQRLKVCRLLNDYGLPVFTPRGCIVGREEEVLPLYAEQREAGYEGLMVKSLDHVYEVGKRSYGWLKVKPEEDADGIITAINRAHSIEGVPLDRAGSIHVVCEDGSECDVPGIAHDLGADMLAHPSAYIGQWCEFQYMERDRQGGYRHPRFHRIREDKA